MFSCAQRNWCLPTVGTRHTYSTKSFPMTLQSFSKCSRVCRKGRSLPKPAVTYKSWWQSLWTGQDFSRLSNTLTTATSRLLQTSTHSCGTFSGPNDSIKVWVMEKWTGLWACNSCNLLQQAFWIARWCDAQLLIIEFFSQNQHSNLIQFVGFFGVSYKNLQVWEEMALSYWIWKVIFPLSFSNRLKKSLYFKHILKLAMEVLGKYKRYFYQTQGWSTCGIQFCCWGFLNMYVCYFLLCLKLDSFEIS